MSIENIYQDYLSVVSSNITDSGLNDNAIYTYYGLEEDQDDYISLADNTAATALNEYSRYISALYFPIDGSWITFKGNPSKTSIEEIGKLREFINTELVNRRFYHHVFEVIKTSTALGKALLNIDNSNGLNFDNIYNSDIVISKERGDSQKRAYGKTTKTVLELITGYEGDIINELMSQYVENGELKMDMAAVMIKEVIVAILPISKELGIECKDKRAAYKKVLFLHDNNEFRLLTPKEGNKEEVFYSFPLLNYSYNGKKTLAELALPYAVNINRLKMQLSERVQRENHPTIILDKKTLQSNAANFGIGGMIATSTNEVQPKAITLTGSSSVNREHIVDEKNNILETFMIHSIRQVKQLAVTNAQAAEMILAVMKEVNGGCGDLVPFANDLLNRICSILETTTKNREIKKLLKKYKKEAYGYGMQATMEKLKKQAKFGRFLQAASGYIQVDPEARDVISGDKALLNLARAMDFAEVLVDSEGIAEKRRAKAEADQGNVDRANAEVKAKQEAARKKV